MGVRINVRISEDDYEKLKEWSKNLGITMSQLGGISLHSGLFAVLRAVQPEAGLDPAYMAKIVAEMNKIDEVKNGS